MNFISLNLENKEHCKKWDTFVKCFGSGAYHHKTNYLKAILSTYNHEHFSIFCIVDGEIVGTLPLIGIKSRLFGNQLTSTPYYNYGGVLSNNTSINIALIKKAKEIALSNGYSNIQIRSIDDVCPNNWTVETHKANMILELPDNIKKIGAGNSKKRAKLRSQSGLALRKATDAKIEIKQLFGGKELLSDFYSVFSRHMRDLGTPVFGIEFFENMLSNINSEITVVYWGKKPVSCGFLFLDENETSIPWASTLKIANPMSVNSYMYYNIIDRCIERGDKIFDFGRSTIGAGTYKFKEQWGALPKQSYWHSSKEENTNNPASFSEEKYGLFIILWKITPLPIANIIGPHIIKKIPA